MMWLTYIILEAIFVGGSLPNVPANIALVLCKPEGILSKTGRPRRETNSCSNR